MMSSIDATSARSARGVLDVLSDFDIGLGRFLLVLSLKQPLKSQPAAASSAAVSSSGTNRSRSLQKFDLLNERSSIALGIFRVHLESKRRDRRCHCLPKQAFKETVDIEVGDNGSAGVWAFDADISAAFSPEFTGVYLVCRFFLTDKRGDEVGRGEKSKWKTARYSLVPESNHDRNSGAIDSMFPIRTLREFSDAPRDPQSLHPLQFFSFGKCATAQSGLGTLGAQSQRAILESWIECFKCEFELEALLF